MPILLLWLIETDVFHLPQLHKHYSVNQNQLQPPGVSCPVISNHLDNLYWLLLPLFFWEPTRIP
jgi:hypothetical protein